MKVKNIVFSGFAAAILAAGAANAATTTQIASRAYVDNKVTAEVDALQTTISNTYVSNDDLEDAVADNIDAAMTKEGGALKEALDAKADAQDVEDLAGDVETLSGSLDKKADKIEVTAAQAGNIATVDANGQYQVSEVKAADLVTNDDVDEKIQTALSGDEFKETITDIVGSADIVTGAIDKSVTEGTLKEELDKKANADDVYTKEEVYNKEQTDAQIIKLAIPQPTGECAANSGRCVLSIDTEGKGLMWLDITEPLEEMPQ